MSIEDNKATTRRIFEEVLNKGNLALVDEIVSSDNVFHTPTGPVHGLEGYKQFVNMYLSAFPDLKFTIEDEIAEGDKVVTRYTSRGTHRADLQGIPPTGKQVTVTGIVIGRFANGKLVEGWLDFDALGMLQQLGVIPAPGPAS
jgi:steroid delta-isomerase-like uncharacterized protein